MRKNYFNLTLESGLADGQRLLDHSTFTTSHAIYISQFVPNLEDDVIPESINKVRILFLKNTYHTVFTEAYLCL